MKWLIGLVVGVALGAVIGYVLWGSKLPGLEARIADLESKLQQASAAPAAVTPLAVKNKYTVIRLKGDGTLNGVCSAEVDDLKLFGRRKMKVAWIAEQDPTTPCMAQGAWRIEIEWVDTGKGYPGNRQIKPRIFGATLDDDGIGSLRVRDNAEEKFPFIYKIYMANQASRPRYILKDPELEIEP